MRLGIDITPLQTSSPGGIGVATYHTLRALSEFDDLDIVLYGRSAPVLPFSDTPLDMGLELRLGEGITTRAGNMAWLQFGVAPMLAEDRIDVFWGTRHVLPRNAPAVALVATLYDFWHATHPEHQPFVNSVLDRLSTRAVMRDGDAFAAISHSTADDARSLFPDSAQRVRTVALGVDRTEFAPVGEERIAAMRERLGLSGPLLLALDVYNVRKNFSTVLDSAARMRDAVPPFEIVAVGAGRSTARDSGIVAQVERLGLTSQVHFVGDVAHADLVALYGGCAAFVYPSVYEGFGMPVLEAMSCGAPVVCSNTSSIPEVAGDAALTVDPTSPEELALALSDILGNPAQAARLRALGMARAAQFTWDRTAAGMHDIFVDALTMHPRRVAEGDR